MPTVSWSSQDTPRDSTRWQTLANSFGFPNLPYKSSTLTTASRFVERDIYYDITRLINSTAQFKSVYADVIGFPSSSTTLVLPPGGTIALYCRVLSAASNLTLNLTTDSTRTSAVIINASTLDSPITCVIGSNPPFNLDINPAQGRCGAQISLTQGSYTVKYVAKWDSLEVSSPELKKTLNTQLRLASILFWLRPRVAQAMASHVALVTYNSSSGAMLNINANAIGQQLLAMSFTGSDLNFAPVLTLEAYKRTLQAALDVAAAYEQQYNRFSDRSTNVTDQLTAFDAMIAKAQDVVSFQTTLAEDAELRWNSACDTLIRSEASLRDSQRDLQAKEAFFKVGLDRWRVHKSLEAAFTVISAIVTFAAAIGEMCVGDPAGLAAAPAQAEAAVSTITAVANVATTTSKVITKANLTKLKTSLSASLALYESTNKVVLMARSVQLDRNVTPSLLTKDESVMQRYGMDDIETLAAWDEWILEADQQMQWTETEKVEFATPYRLALRKHAVEGKLVSQARTQAIKAGQEFSTLAVSLQMANADLERLQTVRSTFQNESDKAEEARALFYDKLMMIKTGVLIEMRKATLAYKYLSLADSRVSLDPTKSITDVRADSLLITQEVERWQERFSSDFSPFTPSPMLASEISPGLAEIMVASFQTTGIAKFTLAPTTAAGAGAVAISGPFTDGSRFRIQGVRVYLVGAKVKTPAANGTGSVTLAISTSGLYADIQAGTVSNFVMTPFARPFKYNMAAGSDGKAGTTVAIDSFIPSRDYVEPTPFSQWTVTIRQSELLDLSGLTDIKFEWQGSARFNV